MGGFKGSKAFIFASIVLLAIGITACQKTTKKDDSDWNHIVKEDSATDENQVR